LNPVCGHAAKGSEDGDEGENEQEGKVQGGPAQAAGGAQPPRRLDGPHARPRRQAAGRPGPAKAAARPKPAAKPAKAPAKKPAPRPHSDVKPSAKPERAPKPAAKAAAPRPAPARETTSAKPIETPGRAEAPATQPANQPGARDGKAAANGAAKTAAAALKARVPSQENVRKLPERSGPAPEPFTEGDFVVYPTHGVGRVVAIETQQIAGISLPLIVITFDKDRMTLRVPVAKAHNSGLRKLSSRKVMDTALATLKGRSRVKRTMWSRRAQEYEAKINSGDPVSIAEVVRDLHRGSDQPDQSYSERQIYQAALDRLARELAAVERIDEQAAAQRLEDMLKAA
jgi:CarD family transcriptional regulator